MTFIPGVGAVSVLIAHLVPSAGREEVILISGNTHLGEGTKTQTNEQNHLQWEMKKINVTRITASNTMMMTSKSSPNSPDVLILSTAEVVHTALLIGPVPTVIY